MKKGRSFIIALDDGYERFKHVSGTPKKLSDFAENVTPEDEFHYENAKKMQLLRAYSPKPRWPPILSQVEHIGVSLLWLSAIIPKLDQLTKDQIDFFAKLDAFREYMERGSEGASDEVKRHLAMDMVHAFVRCVYYGMVDAEETKLQLQEAKNTIASQRTKLDRREEMLRDMLSEMRPKCPALSVKAVAKAFKVSTKTISRWDKYRRGRDGGIKPPVWYRGRNITIFELGKLVEEAEYHRKLTQLMNNSVKNASPYREDRDRPADDDE